MTKHTEGPWTVKETVGGFQIFNGAAPVRVHTEANARLIAAAPELLEAAKTILANNDGVRFRVVLSEAIAKAEGGTE